MTVEEARLLYAYDSWANRRVLDVCAGLPAEQFTRDLGSSFPSVRETLSHICSTEWIWLERWRQRTPGAIPRAADSPDLPSLRRRWAEVESDLLGYVASLSADDLAQLIHYKTMAGVPQTQQLWQTLQHVVNHSTYHRGQLTTMLRQLGAKPVGTDLIGFYRKRASQVGA